MSNPEITLNLKSGVNVRLVDVDLSTNAPIPIQMRRIIGADTKFKVEVYLHNFRLPVIGLELQLEYSDFLLEFHDTEGFISLLGHRLGKRIAYGTLMPVEIPLSGHIASLTFNTRIDVTGIPFFITLHSLRIAGGETTAPVEKSFRKGWEIAFNQPIP